MAKKKKTRKRAVSKKKPARRKRARTSKLSAASTTDIVKELERRERLLGKLEGKRDQLLDALTKIEKEIAAFGRTVARRGRPAAGAAKRGRPRATGARKASSGRKRPKNAMNLVASLAKVLKGKTMGVSEVTVAVQKAGYKTTSPNFRTIVNQTLINNKSKFKKISRGKYSAK